MAEETTGKKAAKKKTKSKPVSLNEFLASNTKEIPPLKQPAQSWADESEHLEADDTPQWPSEPKPSFDRSLLPSAPRAATAIKIDLSRLPPNPPYTIYLGNLSYDCSEDDIKEFFQRKKVQVNNVRLPKETSSNRLRGFGYAELSTKQDLGEALALSGETLKNRVLKIDLAGDKNQDEPHTSRGGGTGGVGRKDHQDDRMSGNWRNAPTDDNSEMERTEERGRGYQRNDDSYGGRGGDYGRSYRNDDRERDRPPRSHGYGSGWHEGDERRPDRYRDRYRDDRDSRDSGPRGYGRDDRDHSFSSRRGEGYEGPHRGDRYEEPRRSEGGRFDGRDDRRPRYGRRDHSPEEREKERPKLHLQPRSKPVESPVAASSIFGGAKPVDTASREKAIEERLLKEKEKEEQELRSPKNKLDQSSIFGGAKPVDTAAREREIEEKLRRSQEREEPKENCEERAREGRNGTRKALRSVSNEDEKSLPNSDGVPSPTGDVYTGHEVEAKEPRPPSDNKGKQASKGHKDSSDQNQRHQSETSAQDGQSKGKSETSSHAAGPPYTIYLGNLPYDCTVEDIREFFEKREIQISNIRLPKESGSNQLRGFGYFEVTTRQDAEDVLALSGEAFNGRSIKIDLSTGRPRAHEDSRGHRDDRSHNKEKAGWGTSDDQRGLRQKDMDKPSREDRGRAQDRKPPREKENPWKAGGKGGPRSHGSQKASSPSREKDKVPGKTADESHEVVFSQPSRFAALEQDHVTSGDENDD